MKNNPIGIFDSGIGGLTVANAIKKVLPNEDIIYFGDTEHLPYGEKSRESIYRFSKNIIKFLVNKDCKAIVIACNSASSVMDKYLLKYANKKIVFNVIDPVAELAVKLANGLFPERTLEIGVIGTKATIGSGIYTKKMEEFCFGFDYSYTDSGREKTVIQRYDKPGIKSLATPLLAPMIEEGFINDEISKKVIQNYLSDPILKNIDMLILACTHYPLIYNKINEVKQSSKLKIVAELYRSKIMFFLVHRRYNEAHYCISMYKDLTEKKVSIEKLSFLFSRIFSITKVYKLLRKYYWFEKKIKKITLNFK